jgi:endonuclease/exonuclease/phosphatase family metal-dependent hydrolase
MPTCLDYDRAGRDGYRVATLNAGSMRGFPKKGKSTLEKVERAWLMGQAIGELDVDLIGLQEFPASKVIDLSFRLGLGSDYEFVTLPVYHDARHSPRTVGIAYRKDRFDAVEPLPVHDLFPKNWGHARVTAGSRVWKVHVGKLSPGHSPNAERQDEIEKLLKPLREDLACYDRRVIVLADLNAGPHSEEMEKLLANGLHNKRACSSAHAYPTKHDHPDEPPGRNLDHVLTGTGCLGASEWSHVPNEAPWAKGNLEHRALSDHLPVIVWAELAKN